MKTSQSNLTHRLKNSHSNSNQYATVFTNTTKETRCLSNFLCLCLNKTWAPGPRFVCISQYHNSSSLRKPDTLQAPVGSPASVCLLRLQKYLLKCNYCGKRVEHQTTDNIGKKTRKWNEGFFEIIQKIFDNYLQDKTTAIHTKYKVHLVCIERGNQPILENPMAKTYRHSRRTDQKTPQNFHRKDFMSSKGKTNEQILQTLVQEDMMTMKRGTFYLKNSKNSPSVVKSILKQNWKRLSEGAIRENLTIKPNSPNKKQSFQFKSKWNCIHQHDEGKKMFIKLPLFMSEQNLSTRSKICMYLTISRFF